MTTLRIALLGLMALCLSALSAPGTAENAAPVPDKPELQTCRPRLFFRPTAWQGGLSVAQLRERAAADPFKDRVRLLHSTRANLAMKWLITGDEKAAADALAALKSLNSKVTDSFEGIELVDEALGYDWLYTWKGFSAEDKKLVEDKLLALAEEERKALAGEGTHVFHTRMYAWPAGVGMAGLALHDVRPEGKKLFEFARDYYEQRLIPARRIQDGAIHQGLSYGTQPLMFPLIQFLEAARSGAGIDYFHTKNPADSQWLRDLAYFLIYCVQPDLKLVNYADVSIGDPAKQFRFLLDIFAAEYDNGYAAELAGRISERYKTSGYHAEWIYMFFAFYNPSIKPKPPADLPTFRVFSPQGVGHVFFRTDWTDKATLVHFRCGDYFDDHAHFDQGSFTVFRQGGLALKSGGYWDFGGANRNRYFKQAISTNTVIFNDPADLKDEGQQRNMHYQDAATVEAYLAHKKPDAKPCVETGDILATDDPAWAESSSKDFHFVTADVTAAWDSAKVKRYVRSVAFVDGKHLIVVDKTETARPEIRARWLLHTQVEPKQEGKVWAVRLKESAMLVQPIEPAEPKVTLIGGEGHESEVNGVNYPYTKDQKYVRSHKGADLKPLPQYGLWRMEIEAAKPNATRTFVTVLTVGDVGIKAPAVESATSERGLTVKVDQVSVTFKKPAPYKIIHDTGVLTPQDIRKVMP